MSTTKRNPWEEVQEEQQRALGEYIDENGRAKTPAAVSGTPAVVDKLPIEEIQPLPVPEETVTGRTRPTSVSPIEKSESVSKPLAAPIKGLPVSDAEYLALHGTTAPKIPGVPASANTEAEYDVIEKPKMGDYHYWADRFAPEALDPAEEAKRERRAAQIQALSYLGRGLSAFVNMHNANNGGISVDAPQDTMQQTLDTWRKEQEAKRSADKKSLAAAKDKDYTQYYTDLTKWNDYRMKQAIAKTSAKVKAEADAKKAAEKEKQMLLQHKQNLERDLAKATTQKERDAINNEIKLTVARLANTRLMAPTTVETTNTLDNDGNVVSQSKTTTKGSKQTRKTSSAPPSRSASNTPPSRRNR